MVGLFICLFIYLFIYLFACRFIYTDSRKFSVYYLTSFSCYNVFDKFCVVKTIDKLHACVDYISRHRLFHATIISFVNPSLCRIVKKAKVTNLEAVINCVFIDKSLDNSDIRFQYLGVPQRWDKL